ncbi:ABC transporter ATP-binding protein [Candidatus Acidianus copahuensis]|uniref:ABC transporter ATP-binding protein n=1 Tax=Candidatus Acidianus copahuensis TaxID=1160895 RepID=A0A031LQE8_9CREN|nr:oligopeptide/dipeptide ABC transporter ATP-binding protein [Candidatus Acidianus copahuensis]EZQ10041.1 ABC transporter ATP-binding protein [Candidatus Acidianus copahuensis]
MELIRLEKSTVVFENEGRKVYGLKDVNLRINEGESILVLGESGAGKTTFGRVIVGLQKLTKGKYFYRGKDYRKNMKLLRKEVQYVYQDPISALNQSKTIRDSILPSIKKWRKVRGEKLEEELDNLLKSVEIEPELKNRYPYQLSGGQAQRINIARALSTNPRVLVADEPVTMLDASIRVGIVDLLTSLKNDRGLNLIMITHDLALARYVNYRLGGMRSIVIYGGRIVEEGNFSEILSDPLHPYTKFLVESSEDLEGVGSQEILKKMVYQETNDLPLKGCPFAPRCPFVRDACLNSFPEVAENPHRVFCYIYS